MIHAIFEEASVDEVIASFGSAIRRAALFLRRRRMGYEETVVDEENTTFFVKRKAFEQSG